mgnify:CR=1 FL=1
MRRKNTPTAMAMASSAFAGFGPEIDTFSPKTAAITSFALTGFANLISLGILLSLLGALGAVGLIAALLNYMGINLQEYYEQFLDMLP